MLTRVMMLVAAGLFCSGARQLAGQEELDRALAGFSVQGLIRFSDRDQANQRREQLVRFIWPDGLCALRPKVAEGISDREPLASLDPALLRSVDLYDVDIGGFDFHSLVYVVHPHGAPAGPARLAIVHAGHMPEGAEHYLEAGLSQSVDRLLGAGFTVAILQMPLAGWNRDHDGVLAGGSRFQIRSRLTAGHDELFAAVEQQLRGGTMRFFLEPVVQVTNELFARYPDRAGILMIGLSGGGWTTHLSAAVDPRIDISIPVAGALPLYARPFSPGSKGDAEQEYPPLYKEVDGDGDGITEQAAGVASWLEIFALGAISPNAAQPRRQTQVLNFYDSCCFGGPVYQTYQPAVARRVSDSGGRWQLFVDRSHRGHLISPAAIDQVLQPAIDQLGSQ